MNFDSGTWWMFLLIIGAITTSLTYLIKVALFSRVEKMEVKLNDFEKTTIDKVEHDSDIKEIKTDIETIKSNYTPKKTHTKDFDECRSDIKKITENYLTKEDFLREVGKTDRKMDKMLDLLLKIDERR